MKKQEKQNNSKLKIIPLGGLEQIGMNITAFEYEDSIIVVDCGLAFPEDDMYGVDLVIPDVTYLKENIDRVKGFFITHGHEDHIGAIPYVLKDVNVPIYSTRLTNALIEHKLEEHDMLKKVKRKVVKYGHATYRLGILDNIFDFVAKCQLSSFKGVEQGKFHYACYSKKNYSSMDYPAGKPSKSVFHNLYHQVFP